MPKRPSPTPPLARPPAWLDDAVFYQIYPQSFRDSNGDGIGDIPGIIEKLDYLRDLGVTALWLNPVFDSPFGDAGYDVRDFRKVAPRYGTDSDLRRLFREAHKRGLRVILDLVAGHTSAEHPWFRDSALRVPGALRDRYVWTDTPWAALGEKGFIIGNTERAAAYQANFFYFQPSLNYGYARPDPAKPWQQPVSAPGPQATRAELRAIMEFWLKAGCDGFRVDMADSLVKGDPDRSGIRALWHEFRVWLDRDWPEAALVSEWGNPAESVASGFHIDFLLHFGEPAYRHLLAPCVEPAPRDRRFATPCYFQTKGGTGILPFLENYTRHLRATAGRGHVALPTGNHDFSRPTYGRTPAELRVIYAMLFTLPGVPFIYYGDEIGLRYRDDLPSKEGGYGRTGTRLPMAWDASRNRGFSTAATSACYLPPDSTADAPDVLTQTGAPDSLLEHTRALLALRHAEPALRQGAFRPLFTDERDPLFAYLRTHADTAWLIVINPCARRRTAAVRLAKWTRTEPALEGAATARLSDGRLTLTAPPISFGLFRLLRR
ncbi:MAG: glycosylase [Burkholderiales bacterium]|nr:glycosylase [Opitutaceae bacterium]